MSHANDAHPVGEQARFTVYRVAYWASATTFWLVLTLSLGVFTNPIAAPVLAVCTVLTAKSCASIAASSAYRIWPTRVGFALFLLILGLISGSLSVAILFAKFGAHDQEATRLWHYTAEVMPRLQRLASEGGALASKIEQWEDLSEKAMAQEAGRGGTCPNRFGEGGEGKVHAFRKADMLVAQSLAADFRQEQRKLVELLPLVQASIARDVETLEAFGRALNAAIAQGNRIANGAVAASTRKTLLDSKAAGIGAEAAPCGDRARDGLIDASIDRVVLLSQTEAITAWAPHVDLGSPRAVLLFGGSMGANWLLHMISGGSFGNLDPYPALKQADARSTISPQSYFLMLGWVPELLMIISIMLLGKAGPSPLQARLVDWYQRNADQWPAAARIPAWLLVNLLLEVSPATRASHRLDAAMRAYLPRLFDECVTRHCGDALAFTVAGEGGQHERLLRILQARGFAEVVAEAVPRLQVLEHEGARLMLARVELGLGPATAYTVWLLAASVVEAADEQWLQHHDFGAPPTSHAMSPE